MSEPRLTPAEVLSYVPHRRPFRFIDEVLEISEAHALSRYTFREDEFFYEGHFPQFKVTPGVILLEAMGQMGAATLGIYLLSLSVPRAEISAYGTVLTDSELELTKPVFPGETVTCRGEKLAFRHGKLRTKVELRAADGSLAALAVIGGMSVRRPLA